jgi:hypothetical protein
MVTSDGNGKVSSKKVVFLATWGVSSVVVGEMAWNGSLNWDVFSAYLLFGMGSDTASKLIAMRYRAKDDAPPAA